MKYLLILFSFLSLNIWSQKKYVFENYTFSNAKYTIPDKFKNSGEITLESNKKVQFINEKSGSTIAYELLHEKVLLNSDEAVERNNKVYIPIANKESLLKNKVRVILASGKEILFNDKEIQEEKDSESGVTYKYFAVKGLEKGAIIEKIFVLKDDANFQDNETTVSKNFPILKFSFELIFPKHLVFNLKSYNNLPSAEVKNDAYPDYHSMVITDENIASLPSKIDYSNRYKYLKRFRYKLYGNTSTRVENLFNYKDFTSRFYDFMNEEYSKKTLKELEKFITVKNLKTTVQKIRAIEHEVKTKIVYDRYYQGNEAIENTIKVKKGNITDITKLLYALYRTNNVKCEIVFTTNRYKKHFDEDFETTGNLSDVLIYFPEANGYIDPISIDDRYPLFPYGNGNNIGLFIKEKEFDGTKMGVGKLGFINLPDITKDTMIIKVDMSQNPEEPTVTSEIRFNGYAASNFQPIKDFVQPEQFKEIIKDIAKNYSLENTEIQDIKTENDGLINLGIKPYIMKLKFKSKEIVQKAGDTYLVKIGETIGRQAEMYDSLERTIPIEIQYPHYYNRKIELVMPDGYKVSNADETKLHFETVIDGKKVAYFDSKYNIKGNIFEVLNDEYYTIVEYPLDVYPSFRDVINAASDFNKVVVALKKK